MDAERLFADQDSQDPKASLSDDERKKILDRVERGDAEIVQALKSLSNDDRVTVQLRLALARARLHYGSALPLMDDVTEWLERAQKRPFRGRDAEILTLAGRVYLEAGLPWNSKHMLAHSVSPFAELESERSWSAVSASLE